MKELGFDIYYHKIYPSREKWDIAVNYFDGKDKSVFCPNVRDLQGVLDYINQNFRVFERNKEIPLRRRAPREHLSKDLGKGDMKTILGELQKRRLGVNFVLA